MRELGLIVLQGRERKRGEVCLQLAVRVTKMKYNYLIVANNIARGSAYKLRLIRFKLNSRTNLFASRVVQQGKRLSGESVESPSLKVSETKTGPWIM